MARNKGTFNFSGNLEVKKDAPLEANSYVEFYEDLIKPETWTTDGTIWLYDNKNVVCKDRPGKIYQLIDKTNYTSYDSWKEISGQEIEIIDNLITDDATKPLSAKQGKILNDTKINDVPKDGENYVRNNGTWIKDNIVNISYSILNLTTSSSSAEILNIFGGLDKFKEIINKLRSNNCIIIVGNKNGSYTFVFDYYNIIYTDDDNIQLNLFDVNYDASGNIYRRRTFIKLIDNVASITANDKFSLVDDFLSKNNTISYIPKTEYNPATKKYVDDNKTKIVVIPYQVLELENTATSEQIAAAFGGKDKFLELFNSITKNSIPISGLNQDVNCMSINMQSIFKIETTEDGIISKVIRIVITNELIIVINYSNDTFAINFETKIYLEDVSDNNLYFRTKGQWQSYSVPVQEKEVFIFQPTVTNNKITVDDYGKIQTAVNDKKVIMYDYEGYGEYGIYTPASTSDSIILSNINNTGTYIDGNSRTNSFIIQIKNNLDFNKQKISSPNLNDVLIKNNVAEYTPSGDYNPATKKYVDDKIYGNTITTTASTLIVNANLTGQDAINRIDAMFANNMPIVVSNIINYHTRYFFHIDDNNNCIELGAANVWQNTERTAFEIHFIINYLTAGKECCKRISIRRDNNTISNNFIIIKDVIISDNLTTMTKKTQAEYDSISTKDDGTMYAIIN